MMDTKMTAEVLAYCAAHSGQQSAALSKIEEETLARMRGGHMVSGGYQGRLLAFLSKLVQPKYVLDIGTFTGFSAICFAEGLADGGKVISLESDVRLMETIGDNLSRAGVEDRVEVHYGRALDIIPELDMTFDLIFLDAAKKEYLAYYEALFPKWRSGGLLLADNVLWKNKVLDEEMDDRTQALHDFNAHVEADERVSNFLFPIRDGIMAVLKH